MAITIGQTNDFIYTSSTQAIRKTVKIKIQADGTVSNTNIDLGNQGDDGVTILEFNVVELIDKPEQFDPRYKPAIIAKNSLGITRVIKFDGIHFFVPNTITQYSGTWELVYTLRERADAEADEENVTTEIEVFTSSIFKGEVKKTNYGLISWDEPVELPQVEIGSLIKPKIDISYEGKVLSTGANLGYKLDNYIKYLQVQPQVELTDYAIYFTGYFANAEGKLELQTKGYKFINQNSSFTCWVPPEVTANAGDYQLMIIGYADNGYEYVSDVFGMKVIDNKLTDADFTADSTEVPLYENNLMQLLDENNNPILVERSNKLQESYTLQYTGEEVDRLLGEVDNNLDNRITQVENNLSFTEQNIIEETNRAKEAEKVLTTDIAKTLMNRGQINDGDDLNNYTSTGIYQYTPWKNGIDNVPSKAKYEIGVLSVQSADQHLVQQLNVKYGDLYFERFATCHFRPEDRIKIDKTDSFSQFPYGNFSDTNNGVGGYYYIEQDGPTNVALKIPAVVWYPGNTTMKKAITGDAAKAGEYEISFDIKASVKSLESHNPIEKYGTIKGYMWDTEFHEITIAESAISFSNNGLVVKDIPGISAFKYTNIRLRYKLTKDSTDLFNTFNLVYWPEGSIGEDNYIWIDNIQVFKIVNGVVGTINIDASGDGDLEKWEYSDKQYWTFESWKTFINDSQINRYLRQKADLINGEIPSDQLPSDIKNDITTLETQMNDIQTQINNLPTIPSATTETAGKFLMSDGNGGMSWQSLPEYNGEIQ